MRVAPLGDERERALGLAGNAVGARAVAAGADRDDGELRVGCDRTVAVEEPVHDLVHGAVAADRDDQPRTVLQTGSRELARVARSLGAHGLGVDAERGERRGELLPALDRRRRCAPRG